MDYTRQEFMAIATGRELRDGELAIFGVGLSMLAGYWAKKNHAPNLRAFTEGGIVGFGCAGEREACDDIHRQQGALAVIQRARGTSFGGGQVNAFLFTSVLERPSRMLLNVENGDYGVLESRDCGCELGELGLKQHLHTVRSFDRLTGVSTAT